MRRSPFDVLGWVALVAFGLSFWALYHAARRTPAEDPQAQVLDPSAEIQEGHEWMGLYFRGERAGYAHVHKERLPTGWRSFLETRFRLLGAAGGEVLLEVDARLGVDLALEHFTFVLEAGPAGDALVELNVRPHAFFRREGQDVHMDLNISLTEAVEGAKIQAPTPGGAVTLTIPAGSNSGKTLRLKGKGVAGQGDQFVRLQVVLPENVDDDLKKFVKKWPKRDYTPTRPAG